VRIKFGCGLDSIIYGTLPLRVSDVHQFRVVGCHRSIGCRNVDEILKYIYFNVSSNVWVICRIFLVPSIFQTTGRLPTYLSGRVFCKFALPVITLKQNKEVVLKLHFTEQTDPLPGIYIYLFLHGTTATSGPDSPYYRDFTNTLGRNPLGEWSAPLRDLYLTTQHSQETNINPGQRWNPQSQEASYRRPTN